MSAPFSEKVKHPRYRWRVYYTDGAERLQKYFKNKTGKGGADEFLEAQQKRLADEGTKEKAITAAEARAVKEFREAVALLPGEAGAATLADAVNFYVQHLNAKAKHDATPLSVVVKRFLDEKEHEGLSEVHLADLKNRIARFEITFGKKSIASIHRNDIAAWLNELPLAPQSKINFRRVLGNLFSYAVRAGNIVVNPVTATSPPKSRRQRAVILTPEEVEKLLNASPAETLPALVLMTFCGIRNREMFRLDWSAVDWEDNTVEITAEQGKREGHARHVTISAAALEWLRPHAKKRGKIADFRDFDEYTRRLQDARSLAGWAVGKWPENALRKTFISCHYETHGSIDDTAKQAGTSVGMIHKHYRKLIKKKEAEKLWKIHPTAGPKNLLPFQPTAKSAVQWPSPEDLQAMLWQRPVVEIAREIGVSDVAVVKHATRHRLTKPPRGYWLKHSSQTASR